MEAFEYNANPARVVFGSGTIKRLPQEIQRLQLKSPIILSTPRQKTLTESVVETLKAASIETVGTYLGARMHTPVYVTEEAMEFLSAKSADCIVSLGGGSVIGLGKALSIRTGLYHLCIPTTYAGSEMTARVGETKDGVKKSRSDPKLLPGTVIYDVDLTMSFPPALSATSGVNALAHSVEALYAENTNPVISLLAIESVKALAESLPTIIEDPSSRPAREKALYGAWLCGLSLGSATMGIHHKLAHTLGGSLDLPHAETHTIILPHSLSYNAPAIPGVMEKLAEVLPGSEGDAVKGLNVLLDNLKVKRALKDFGMKEEDIDKVADIAMTNQYPNPRPVERDAIREVIRRCWAGEPARADL